MGTSAISRLVASAVDNKETDLLRNNTSASQLKTLKTNSGQLSVFHAGIHYARPRWIPLYRPFSFSLVLEDKFDDMEATCF